MPRQRSPTCWRFIRERLANESYFAHRHRTALGFGTGASDRLRTPSRRGGAARRSRSSPTTRPARRMRRSSTSALGCAEYSRSRRKSRKPSRPSKKSPRGLRRNAIAAAADAGGRQPQVGRSTRVYLKGTATNLKPGDAILAGRIKERGRSIAAANAGIFSASSRRVAVDYRRESHAHRMGGRAGHDGAAYGVAGGGSQSPCATPARFALFGAAMRRVQNRFQSQTLIRYGFDLGALTDWTSTFPSPRTETIDLDLRPYPSVIAQSWLAVLSKPSYQRASIASPARSVASRARFQRLTGKTTRIQLDIEESFLGFIRWRRLPRHHEPFAQSEFSGNGRSADRDAITGATIELAKIPVGLRSINNWAATGQWQRQRRCDQRSRQNQRHHDGATVQSDAATQLKVTRHQAPVSLSTPMSPRRPAGETVQELPGGGDAGKFRLSNCASRR